MKISLFLENIQNRLNSLLQSEEFLLKNSEEDQAVVRRTGRLIAFNIIKQESLLFEGLWDLIDKIPLDSWPVKNLPTGKLEELKGIVQEFQKKVFLYDERKFYSMYFWEPILASLVVNSNHFELKKEFYMTKLESDYPAYRIDFALVLKEKTFVPPLLFVEIGRDHLIGSDYGHKDDEKIAQSMGASLLKILSLKWNSEIELLEKLKVFGILGAGTLGLMYAVFPDDDKSEFYFVFSSSKKKLRFRILEELDFDKELGKTTHKPRLCPINMSGDLIGKSSDERYCINSIRRGYCNEKSLQMLETLSELIQEQADLLSDIENNSESGFKFDEELNRKMTSGRSAHRRSSTPDVKKRTKNPKN